jgi:N-acetylglucosaminyl-diphospho-decaprenol L-rhamnosyltransferase
VLTHNRCDELDATLRQLESLPEAPEIVVIDNGSSDGTAEMVRARHPQAIYVRLERNIGAAARNVGVCLCDHPYVALCDDDTWWEPGSLRRAADLLDAHPALAVVTARVLVGADERLDPACTPMAESPLDAPAGLPGKPLLGFLAGASMVRRSAFVAAGGFEPRLFLGGEEELLAYDLAAAGWQLSYVDHLTVHHFPSPARDARARRRMLARNRVWVVWLRRPLPSALAETLRLLRRGLHDADARLALLDAARGLPWALRHRRALPRTIERGIRQLEQAGFR